MELVRSDCGLVSKYIHDDTSETAIKLVSSCDTIKNPVTGVLEMNPVDRNKYSIFISASAGCYMKCDFCYLTMKEMAYSKISEDEIIENLKEALISELVLHPEISDKYVKICWMGMGDAINKPTVVYNVTLKILNWILDNKLAKGLDGIDLSSVLPKVNNHWINIFWELNKTLEKYPTNPLNKMVVHSEANSNLEDYSERSPFRLFYSLHSAIQDTRNEIIPNAMSISESINILKYYSKYNLYNIIFHHMFINGINDSEEEVQEFLNLIMNYDLYRYEFRILRYNQCDSNHIKESDRFKEIIERISLEIPNLKIQISTGKEIQSACGQFITPYGNKGK